jgi:hypothetical protein
LITRSARGERGILQIRPVDHVRHRHQAREVDRAVARIDVLGAEAELVLEQTDHLRGTSVRDFEAHGITEASLV